MYTYVESAADIHEVLFIGYAHSSLSVRTVAASKEEVGGRFLKLTLPLYAPRRRQRG